MKRLFFIIVIIIFLDFIPIKFAVNDKYIDKKYNDTYVCSYIQTTGESLYASAEDNIEVKEDIFFDKMTGSMPYCFLSQEYTTDFIEPSGNKYILQGETKSNEVEEFNVKKWDIKYPICRKTIRALYAPKSYLTIYDFNWYGIFKNIME